MGDVIRRAGRGMKMRGVMGRDVGRPKEREVVEVGLLSVRKVGKARKGSVGKIKVEEGIG